MVDGIAVDLPVLSAFAPHSLHGDGWRAPWSLERSGEGRVVMRHHHAPDAWPWAYEAEQAIDLDEAGLTIALSVVNLSDRPMPTGLGLHPYFARPEGGRLTLAAPQVWETDANDLPTRLSPAGAVTDWTGGVALDGLRKVDHAYAGWDGVAELTFPDRRVTVTASPNARWVQVYAPPGEPYVCVEPVTHRPDALNAPDGEETGVIILQPGRTLSVTLRITAAEPGL